MLRHDAAGHPWANLLTELGVSSGWDVSAATMDRYCTALAALLPDDADPETICTTCRHYHHDHQTYHALCNPTHPEHDAMWQHWLDRAARIVVNACGNHPAQPQLEVEDLVQAALLELVRGLQTFRFQSSLTTWIYAVIARTTLRVLRDSHAKKRPQDCVPLEELPNWETLLPATAAPEVSTNAWMLAGLVRATLHERDAHPHLAQIVLLAAADQSTEMIGRLVHLHPSRVRALLVQARQILQSDPAIRAWLVDSPQTR